MRRHRRPAAHVEELVVERLAIGGAGVAKRADGSAVFVPGTAPGERVQADVDARTRPARGRLLRVLEPSRDRVAAACPFVDACGGCDWMHLSLEAQRAGHAELVRAAIAHATSIADLPAVRVHPAPAPLAYRARARLHAAVHRGRVRVGFRGAASHELAEIDTCAVLDPELDRVLVELPALLAGASGSGEIVLARGGSARPIVEIHWRGELAASTWAAIDARVPSAWDGARVLLEGASLPASFGDPRPRMVGADGFALVIAPGGFAQTSEAGASLLARRVADLALGDAPAAGRHVLELFAGSGTLSILLAAGAASFAAVELDPEAARSARENLAARGLDGKVTAANADAFAIPPRAEVTVLDPPRAGAAGAASAIAASRVRRVVYVACDAATLARDLGVMTRAGLRITEIETFELFPQTSHVEVVVRLGRDATLAS